MRISIEQQKKNVSRRTPATASLSIRMSYLVLLLFSLTVEHGVTGFYIPSRRNTAAARTSNIDLAPLLFLAQPSSSSSSSSEGASRNKSKNTKTKPKKSKNSNARRRNSNNKHRSNNERRHQAPQESRPILALYEENTDPELNHHRTTAAKIDCVHFDECSGCSVQSKVGSEEVVPTLQSAKAFFSSPWIRQTMIQPQPQQSSDTPRTNDDFFQVMVPSPLTAWRTQAKLVATPKSSAWAKDGIQFGLYRSRSHDVVPIPECAVHHPSINRGIAVLEQATAKVGIGAYEEERREGGLRYIQMQVERITGKVSLTLVWNAEALKDTQPALSRLVKELNRLDPDLWHSLWVNCNDGIGNNILARNPKRWHRISGPEFLREPLAVGDKGWLYFTPLTFRQGNMDGFDILANDVARRVPAGSKVCELYAGVGLLGLTALAHHEGRLKWLRCSDENPSNLRCFQRAVDSLPPDWVGRGIDNRKKRPEEELTIAQLMERMQSGESVQQKKAPPVAGEKASYLVASAAKALRTGQALGADVLIVDPPRKGLEPEVLEELCKPIDRRQDSVEDISMLTIPDEMARWTNDARTLIYVSCGFEALARDAERLLTSTAGWKLESATGYVLFPGSDHVETLCIFQRD